MSETAPDDFLPVDLNERLLACSYVNVSLRQDLSSWSSADELDTSGSLSPVSGRSTPSRQRSVTHTHTHTRTHTHTHAYLEPSDNPLKAMFTPIIPRALLTPSSTSTIFSTLLPCFPACSLFMHVVHSRSKILSNFSYFLLG